MESVAEIFQRYLDEKGLFTDFKAWAEAQGYKMKELEFDED